MNNRTVRFYPCIENSYWQEENNEKIEGMHVLSTRFFSMAFISSNIEQLRNSFSYIPSTHEIKCRIWCALECIMFGLFGFEWNYGALNDSIRSREWKCWFDFEIPCHSIFLWVSFTCYSKHFDIYSFNQCFRLRSVLYIWIWSFSNYELCNTLI